MNYFNRYILTPATLITFIFIGFSGVALYFHFFPNIFHHAHEYIGLGFVALAILHSVKHWKSILNYMKANQSIAVIIILGISMIALIASTTSPKKDKETPSKVINAIEHSQLTQVAPALGIPSDTAIKHLVSKGISAEPNQSIDQIAQNSNSTTTEILKVIISDSNHDTEKHQNHH